MDYRFNIHTDNPDVNLQQYTGYEHGTGKNSFSSGISLNLIYDTRNNLINPMPGVYGNFVYRVNPSLLGSNHDWSSVYLDVRKYIGMNPSKKSQQNTLAFWSYFWSALSNSTPYGILITVQPEASIKTGIVVKHCFTSKVNTDVTSQTMAY